LRAFVDVNVFKEALKKEGLQGINFDMSFLRNLKKNQNPTYYSAFSIIPLYREIFKIIFQKFLIDNPQYQIIKNIINAGLEANRFLYLNEDPAIIRANIKFKYKYAYYQAIYGEEHSPEYKKFVADTSNKGPKVELFMRAVKAEKVEENGKELINVYFNISRSI
jgi:hypothetical protein